MQRTKFYQPVVIARICQGGLLIALAACVTFWSLRLLEPQPPLQAGALVLAPSAQIHSGAQLFGAPPASNNPQLNLKVLGVLAGQQGGGRVLLSVDGRPAEIFRRGDAVTEEARLVRISKHEIILEQQGVELSYAVPQLPASTHLIVPGQP